MDIRHLLRMARWARKPPSHQMVKLVFGIIALCICLFVIERYIGWPEALRPNSLKF